MRKTRLFTVKTFGVCLLSVAGCGHLQTARMLYQPPPPPQPLGAQSDAIWQIQETNAMASDFVIHDHEFTADTVKLNSAGMDHVKAIAARLQCGQDFPVVVERTMTSIDPDSEFQFPVNPNPELDLKRRKVIVASLAAMGVDDAEQRVVVAPAYVPGLKGTESEQSYYQGIQSSGFGFGFGGGGGGGGGFGNFGFGGGGFF